MATGIIEIPIYYSNYSKLPDGTLIQWGTWTLQSGTTTQYTPVWIILGYPSLQIPFINTDFICGGNCKYDTGCDYAIGGYASTTSSMALRLWDEESRKASSSSYWTVQWWAIGKWK